jgi:uncharacterized membrane protein
MNNNDGKDELIFVFLAIGIMVFSLFHMWSEAWAIMRSVGEFTTYGIASVITLLGAAVAVMVLND